MEITKYSISEELASEANRANSFRDYETGSATNEYNGILTEFKQAVERLVEYNKKLKYPANAEQMGLVEYYANKYSQKLACAINKGNEIRSRVPSVMVCGAGNFPVKKKEKQNQAMDKLYEETHELYEPTNNYYYRKIANILCNDTIYSDDALAVEKLNNKLQELTESQEEAKSKNAYYRKNKTMKGYPNMTDEEAKKLDERIRSDYSWNQKPFPSWWISNNSAEIRRVKARIDFIEKIKQSAETPIDEKYPHVDGVEVQENNEAMRVQLFFDDKPDEETRELVKVYGFKWSPKYTAWQRQLTPNGIKATQCVLRKLKEKEHKE